MKISKDQEKGGEGMIDTNEADQHIEENKDGGIEDIGDEELGELPTINFYEEEDEEE